ncbi:uncharacterized protein LALA0_S14e00254g [Lachancea lanzarotensis]|uniref:LALA0S14e00254g1_1 n=1 Tax=Lachancea lanzarotensis TaxID=1245769 RepID=A0A0C7MXU5_9SACH|nr:uncharacterized protein LALA0_S14e00254g [Lachancea lanzarotensis]CEP64830.1 LALA0S14e00254g1_1 [Lachancea lanzarotensis]
MKLAKTRRKGSGKRAFGSANNESDNSDREEGLEQYMKQKSAKIAENLPKTAVVPELQDDPKELEKPGQTPQKSKLISRFKAAKQQRDLDKLQNEALKADLEGQNFESYVTEGYKEKKEALNQASKEAEREEKQEEEEFRIEFPASASRMNALLINAEEKSPEKSIEGDSNSGRNFVDSQKGRSGQCRNDIYVGNTKNRREIDTTDIRGSSSSISTDISPGLSGELVIAEYLASKKTTEELAHQRQLYLARKSMES